MNEDEQDIKETSPLKSQGGRNLAIFGILAVSIAVLTAGVSLVVYRATGDIYLDRSRPGFIPEDGDNSSKNEQTSSDIVFPQDGPIDQKTIDDYLKSLDTLQKDITSDLNAFSSSVLSDENLGIDVLVEND